MKMPMSLLAFALGALTALAAPTSVMAIDVKLTPEKDALNVKFQGKMVHSRAI